MSENTLPCGRDLVSFEENSVIYAVLFNRSEVAKLIGNIQ